MSGKADPEGELTRGLGIGIGAFIVLLAAAIAAFAIQRGGDREPPVPRGTAATSAAAPRVAADTEARPLARH